MSKLIDITDKLNFEEKPSVRVKNVDLAINNDAVSMLKVAALFEDGNGKSKDVIEMYHLLFDESEREKIEKLKLNMHDFNALISESAKIATGDLTDEGGSSDPGYDLIDDFDLIVSSFRSEYGVSIYSKDFAKMSWNEFCSLLQGLGPETPLARTVQIRLETDKEVLKNFTSSQHKIRNKWRSRNVKHYSDEDMNTVLAEFQNFFANL